MEVSELIGKPVALLTVMWPEVLEAFLMQTGQPLQDHNPNTISTYPSEGGWQDPCGMQNAVAAIRTADAAAHPSVGRYLGT